MYKLKIKKLFGRESNLQSLSHYFGTPGAETIIIATKRYAPSLPVWNFLLL